MRSCARGLLVAIVIVAFVGSQMPRVSDARPVPRAEH